MANRAITRRGAGAIRQALLDGREMALVDVREEALYAEGHPLFAVNIPLSKLEIEVLARIPRPDTPVTLYDNAAGLAARAAQRLLALGYTDVALLEDDLAGWRSAGGVLFIDVNSPSKSFGEWVEHQRHTPSLAAEQVKELLDRQADAVVLDVRRFDEYQTMNIPGSISVPGAELVLRVRDLAPAPSTRVIVNCAGRTRSIIGAQSLVNAGIANPVFALRNGTIGWTLAGYDLEQGQQRRYGQPGADIRRLAGQDARRVADRAGVKRAGMEDLAQWRADSERTTYVFDVRSPEEYAAGHLPGARPAPGGQLVQETDHYASVRGARIVLVDDLQARADMTASWLAQMNWQVWVLDGLAAGDFSERGAWSPPLPAVPPQRRVDAALLAGWLREAGTAVLDVTGSANYVAGHIPGASWLLRAQLDKLAAADALPSAQRYVVTCGTSLLAAYAVEELERLTGKPVYVLDGGNAAWRAANLPLEQGETQLLSPRIDRYRRPYEGTDVPAQVMQAYLEWEYGLVAQLAQDGTHGFSVIE